MHTSLIKLSDLNELTERHRALIKDAMRLVYGYLPDNLPIQHDVEISFKVYDETAGHGLCFGPSRISINLPSTTIRDIKDDELVIYLASVIVHELFHAKHALIERPDTLFQKICEEGIACHHEINFLGQTDPMLYNMRRSGLMISGEEAEFIYQTICSYTLSRSPKQIHDAVFTISGQADERFRPPGYKLGYFLLRTCLNTRETALRELSQMNFSEIFKLIPVAPFETLPRE
ncbi:hypothetical protein IJ847_02015 [Candidatus Saccharibacteria bacterium]|nr:hypothetical protein [Candidatus Saccharibacteria bacterium]